MGLPDFVNGQRLTEHGQRVIDHLRDTVIAAEAACVGQDTTPLNSLSGVYQDYWVNVEKARIVSPAEFAKTRQYGMSVVFESLQEADRTAQKEAQQEQHNTDVEQRLAELETKLAEALRVIAQKDERIAEMSESAVADAPAAVTDETEEVEDDETADADPEPEKPARKRRTPKAQKGDAPAETDAEGDAETADTDDDGTED